MDRYFRDVVPGKRRFADLIGPIDWLVKAGLVSKAHVCTRPELPLQAHPRTPTGQSGLGR